MTGLIAVIARLAEATERIMGRKWNFLGVFAVIFLGSVIVLAKLDLLPEPLKVPTAIETASVANALTSASVAVAEEPVKIEIPTINLSVHIANPTTTNIKELDEELMKGAVRYPTSAKLGEVGNVVLFAHSSYLPVVGNQAYKAFNGIQKLKQGDIIIISSSTIAYTYSVRAVAKESADEAGINLAVTDKVLTLATCNSFGEKSDRFVVTADFVESHVISG